MSSYGAIDVHAHMVPEPVLRLVADHGRPFGAIYEDGPSGPGFTIDGSLTTGPTPPEDMDLGQRLKRMDAQGIAMQVLSMTTPMFYWAGQDLASRLCAVFNDAVNDAHLRHPARFLGFAQLPLHFPQRAIEELDRIADLPGIRGIYMGTHVGPREVSDPSLFPVYERIEDAGLPLFLHPMQVIGFERLHRQFYLNNLLGNPFETAIAAAHFIFGGVLDAFPRLEIGLPHAGGALPILIGRLAHGHRVRPEVGHLPRSPLDYLRRFSFDTLGHSPDVMSYLIGLVGADRVLLGSDYSADMGYTDPLAAPNWPDELSDEQHDAISHGNAARLLRLA